MPIDLNDPEVKSALETMVADATKATEARFAEKLESETKGLREKNAQLLGEVKKFKEKARVVPDDFDPKAWQTLRDDAEKAKEEAAKASGKWDEYKAELVENHNKTVAELTAERDALGSQLENVLVNNAIMGAIGKAKGNTELLMPHVRPHVKLLDEDGEKVARVVDANGNARIAGAEGNPMSIEALLDELKDTETYAPCFEGSRATGSGAGGAGKGGGAAEKNPFAKDTLNLTEQARLKREEPDTAKRLQAAAASGN